MILRQIQLKQDFASLVLENCRGFSSTQGASFCSPSTAGKRGANRMDLLSGILPLDSHADVG